MRSSRFDLCIKCNCGGKVLVCRGDDCPIVVHDKCLGCPASYDVAGEFDCPYCVYRRAYAELNQAREDVKLRKGVLSSFIDAKMADCDKQNEISERAYAELNQVREDVKLREGVLSSFIDAKMADCDKQNEISERETRKRKAPLGEAENVESFNQQDSTSKAVDSVHNLQLSGQKTLNNISREEERGQAFQVNDVGRTGEDLVHIDVKDDQENANLSGSPSVQEKAREGEKDDLKSLEENEIRENYLGKTASSNETDSIFDFPLGADGEGETSNKRSKRRKAIRPCDPPSASVDCSGRSSPIKNPTKTKKTNIGSEVSQNICRVGRRILWTEQEEEMIKKGVTKYTSRGNKNIPWKKIFEFGRHVFHYSRTPSHLKDKWRTMLAKENLAK